MLRRDVIQSRRTALIEENLAMASEQGTFGEFDDWISSQFRDSAQDTGINWYDDIEAAIAPGALLHALLRSCSLEVLEDPSLMVVLHLAAGTNYGREAKVESVIFDDAADHMARLGKLREIAGEISESRLNEAVARVFVQMFSPLGLQRYFSGFASLHSHLDYYSRAEAMRLVPEFAQLVELAHRYIYLGANTLTTNGDATTSAWSIGRPGRICLSASNERPLAWRAVRVPRPTEALQAEVVTEESIPATIRPTEAVTLEIPAKTDAAQVQVAFEIEMQRESAGFRVFWAKFMSGGQPLTVVDVPIVIVDPLAAG